MTQNYNNNLTLLKGETTMNVFHLSKKQIKILKGMYLSEMQPDISWGELANADKIVSKAYCFNNDENETKRRYPYEYRYDEPLQITRDDTQSLLVSTERAIRTGELVGATRGNIFSHSGAGRRGRPPDHLYKRGEDQMRIDADSKRKKKKKREQSVMEAEMFRFIEKTM